MMLHNNHKLMFSNTRLPVFSLLLFTLLYNHLINAAPGPDITICNDGLTAVKLQDISFGEFEGALGGTITIGTDGNRSATGGVVLLGGVTNAAVFEINSTLPGCEVYPVVIISPSSTILTEPLGNTMSADSFVTVPASGFLVIPGVPQIVEVGANLTATVGQASGTYNTLTPYSFSFTY